jgi:hypothetical protein
MAVGNGSPFEQQDWGGSAKMTAQALWRVVSSAAIIRSRHRYSAFKGDAAWSRLLIYAKAGGA